jgi:hypothetical protein
MKRQKQEKPISDELIDEFLKQGRTADGGGIRSGQFHDMPTLRPSETSSKLTSGQCRRKSNPIRGRDPLRRLLLIMRQANAYQNIPD